MAALLAMIVDAELKSSDFVADSVWGSELGREELDSVEPDVEADKLTAESAAVG